MTEQIEEIVTMEYIRGFAEGVKEGRKNALEEELEFSKQRILEIREELEK